MNEEQIMNEGNIFKKYGIGRRTPNDPFFAPGDKICHMFQREGVIDTIDENMNKRLVESFPCCIPTCKLVLPSLVDFEMHYNSCHRCICGQCKKLLPSYHLLDLHLCEVHDSFFKAQAERKPMYRCFVEECNHLSDTPEARRGHCIDVHKFPHDFRFDYSQRKGYKTAINVTNKKKANNGVKNNAPVIKGNFTFGQSSAKGNVFIPRQAIQKNKNTNNKPRPGNDIESMNEDIEHAESSINLSELMDTLPSESLEENNCKN